MTTVGPWWQETNYQPVGYDSSVYGFHWAGHALSVIAVKNGYTLHETCDNAGTLKKPKAELLEKVLGLGGVLILKNTGIRSSADSGYNYVWPNGAASFYFENSDNVEWDLRSLDEKFFNEFKELMKEFVGPKKSKGKVYVLGTGPAGLRLSSMGVASVPFEKDNYSKEVNAQAEHVFADLKSINPCGRVVILDGLPGSGKTYFVRSIVKEIEEALFVLIPSNMISDLGNPSFIQVLLETKASRHASGPIILIVEDADRCLASRSADNIDAISALLNFSDGIMGAMLDLRIICTTNVQLDQIDEAIMRPGRLCAHIHVGKLDYDQANGVYKRLTEAEEDLVAEDGKEEFTLAEVYRIVKRGKLVAKKKERKPVGFGT